MVSGSNGMDVNGLPAACEIADVIAAGIMWLIISPIPFGLSDDGRK